MAVQFCFGLLWLLLFAVSFPVVTVNAAPTGTEIAGLKEEVDSGLFAEINGEKMLISSYVNELGWRTRQTYYHGKVPALEMLQFQWDTGQEMIVERLLHQEAKRRSIEVDREKLAMRLVELVKPGPGNTGGEISDELQSHLEQQLGIVMAIEVVEKQVREAIPLPTEEELDAYYRANPKMFSSPGKERVSLILKRVNPWSSRPIWDIAGDRLKAVRLAILDGADFAEMARQHSDDTSASHGGDMGYLHRGMLGGMAQDVIDQLQPGEVSEVSQLLEGMALFKLDDRQAPVLNPLAKVRERAIALWQRDQGDLAFANLKRQLRDSATIQVLDQEYLRIEKVLFEDGEGESADGVGKKGHVEGNGQVGSGSG